MSLLARGLPQQWLRWEPALVCLLAWAAFVAVPLSQGEIGVSWDMLNHHIYLGWTAEQPRFDRDLVAAGHQAYQFPYLYWPVYKLATSGVPGAWAGAVLATLQVTAVPAVWMLARTCMPGPTAFDAAMRLLAVLLAFLTGVTIALLDSTANDLMAAIPLVWALALALDPAATRREPALARRRVAWSGVAAGLAVAFKLSNGPLAILLPALWLLSADGLRTRVLNTALGCVATLGAFLLVYGYWGVLLWNAYGNPLYPFQQGLFDALRAMTGPSP